MERTGWLVQLPIIGGFNEPLLMLRAIALALRARLRPLRRLRDIFLLGASTPPYPRRGVLLAWYSWATRRVDSRYTRGGPYEKNSFERKLEIAGAA
jgi:hypothetical protein